MKQDNAFTGLEAAIVLIAFVVVAAVFSYVMLGAGFFATQKAQEVTYSGVKQTTSNLIPDGTIYGNYSTGATPAAIDKLQFSVTVPVGGQAQQLKDLVITYSKEGKIPYNFDMTASGPGFSIEHCTMSDYVDGVTTLIPPGHSCNLILMIDDPDCLSEMCPESGEWFQLEVKPPIGAPTTIKRTIPTGYLGGKLL